MPMPSSRAADLALLRRFEPVLRLTAGEIFLPVCVADYLRPAELVAAAGSDPATILLNRGEVTPESLAACGRDAPDDAALSLRYVERPLTWREVRRWRRDGGQPAFRPVSRTAAVGMVARLIAALIQLTLIVRGTVPGGWTAAAAELSRAFDGHCTYYGRVTRDGGYLVLQYWFLYPMNDWRSSFGGVNDHEADWEQVTLFLTDQPDPELAWVAFSSHDEVGADLRRRPDDPDLTLVGEHPVVFVGAGSHSGTYLPGEFLITIAPDLPRPLETIRRSVARILPWSAGAGTGIGIPYIDYHRGDGLSIGPGMDRQWDAQLIDDETAWVRDYRGLWGLDTRDRFGGERAPAGPRYERDATVRPSWAQPVAWADLDGVPPSSEHAAALWQARDAQVRRRLAAVDDDLQAAREDLRGASVTDLAAGRARPGSAAAAARRRVAELRLEAAGLRTDLDAAGRLRGRPLPQTDPHSHLRHRALPLSAASLGASRLLGAWAALSAGLLMGALGWLLVTDQPNLLAWSVGIVAAMLAIEALLRRRLVGLVLRVTLTTAAGIGALWLVRFSLANLQLATGLLLLLASVYLIARAATEAFGRRGG